MTGIGWKGKIIILAEITFMKKIHGIILIGLLAACQTKQPKRLVYRMPLTAPPWIQLLNRLIISFYMPTEPG